MPQGDSPVTPTAPGFALQVKEDIKEDPIRLHAGGDKYEVKRGQSILAILPKIHRDPAVWGEDAEFFKLERMLNEPFSQLPNNSWKRFGNGMRGCIGRPFAWQEAILTTALLLQNFNFRFDDPSYSYRLHIEQTLTIKPEDFYMCGSLRGHIDPVYLEKMLRVGALAQGTVLEKDRKLKASAIGDPKRVMTYFMVQMQEHAKHWRKALQEPHPAEVTWPK
jgi:cytochrome P450/NADPH-cytochrome P450 reductase